MRDRPTGPIAARLIPVHSFAGASFMNDLIDRQARHGTRPKSEAVTDESARSASDNLVLVEAGM